MLLDYGWLILVQLIPNGSAKVGSSLVIGKYCGELLSYWCILYIAEISA